MIFANLSGRSSVVEHFVANENVVSSNLITRSILKGSIAQLVEHFTCNEDVLGSNPSGTSILKDSVAPAAGSFFILKP